MEWLYNPFTEFPHEIDMGVLKLGQYPNEKERYESKKL